jgi:hypothetical protein
VPKKPAPQDVNPHRCRYPAPISVHYRTSQGWASRDWLKGEKATYERQVLGRDPSDQSYPVDAPSLKQLQRPLTSTN